MSHQFKSGDLALIVGAFTMVQNIGKQCELVQFIQPEEIYVAPNGITYQHADVPVWIVRGDGLYRWFEDETIDQGDWGLCAPQHLIPLRGDFAPEQQKSKEVTA